MNMILETVLLSLGTVAILFIMCYLYALNLDYDFDIPADEINAEDEMRLMMDAEQGGLSRHWNWE